MVKTRLAKLRDMYGDNSWSDDEVASLVGFMFNVSTKRNRHINELDILKNECKRAAVGLLYYWNKETTAAGVHQKLTKLKNQFLKFQEFLLIPGVNFNPSTGKVTINKTLYPYITENEPPLWRYFTLTGMMNHSKLRHIVCDRKIPSYSGDGL